MFEGSTEDLDKGAAPSCSVHSDFLVVAGLWGSNMFSSDDVPYGAEVGLAFERRGGGEAEESLKGLAEPAEIPSPIAARFLGCPSIVSSTSTSLISESAPSGVSRFKAPMPDIDRVGA